MNFFKFILCIFLLAFIYNLSAILVEYSFNLIGLNKDGIFRISSLFLSGIIAFICYKRILKNDPPEEKE
jgi:hypothetical protein